MSSIRRLSGGSRSSAIAFMPRSRIHSYSKSDPPVTFATLQRLLREQGFSTLAGPGYLVNDHALSGCRLVYPAYGDEDAVPLYHLVATQRLLDEFGLLEADAFHEQLRKHAVAG
jgi:hypothetical protein